MLTFLVERYRPGASEADAAAVIAKDVEIAEIMRREGKEISVISSTFVERDEVVLSVVQAHAEEDVVTLGERSGTPVDRAIPATDMLPALGRGEHG
jgi:hypothetical protein